MKFDHLIRLVGGEPVFETGLLLAGEVDPYDVRRQLSRWTRAGRVVQLRRGLYALAPPWRKVEPHPFLVANRLVPGSYVSRHAALAYYGLIPEHVPTVTSVGSGHPGCWDTPLGSFEYRHVKRGLLFGYRSVVLGGDQRAYVASPAKALLDLIHLEPLADRATYLRELRLQNLDRLDLEELRCFADRAGRPKPRRAAAVVEALAREEAREYEAV